MMAISEQDILTAVPLPARKDPPPCNILVVDDRPDKVLALEAILADLGQNVFTARSGKEALRHVLARQFAVILLDVQMPIMNGFETAALIRSRAQSEHTPIIFITAERNSEEQMFQGYLLGAVDYISSPIIPRILRSKVSVFVDLYRHAELVRAQQAQLQGLREAEHRRQLDAAVNRLELETKRNRFFTLSLDLLAIADFEGRFLQLNPAWEKGLGFPLADLQNRPVLDLVHAEDRPQVEETLQSLVEKDDSAFLESRFRCYNHSYRWLACSVSAFAEERLVYIFARDVTEHRLAEERIRNLNYELQQRVQDLTQLNGELENVCYSIAHDLRAPLRAMDGMARALHEDYSGQLDDTGQTYAKRIMDASTRMDCLIRDLLAYGKLNHGDLPLQPIDIRSAVMRCLSLIAPEIKETQAIVKVEDFSGQAQGNPAVLEQVITNLLQNAIKFVAPETRPKVVVRFKVKAAFVSVMIEDNGIGIPRAQQDRIFRMFERLDQKTYNGTGIGLAIVRRGVERMGGKFGVESIQGKGSSFWFALRHV